MNLSKALSVLKLVRVSGSVPLAGKSSPHAVVVEGNVARPCNGYSPACGNETDELLPNLFYSFQRTKINQLSTLAKPVTEIEKAFQDRTNYRQPALRTNNQEQITLRSNRGSEVLCLI